jgi:hypothetical protein
MKKKTRSKSPVWKKRPHMNATKQPPPRYPDPWERPCGCYRVDENVDLDGNRTDKFPEYFTLGFLVGVISVLLILNIFSYLSIDSLPKAL